MEVNNQEWKNEREFFLHLASIRLRSSHSSVRYKHKALFESKLRDVAWSSMNRTPKKRFDEISVRSRLDALMVDFALLISSFHVVWLPTTKISALVIFWWWWWGSEKARPSWTCVIMYHKVSQRHWAVNFIAMPVSRVWSNGFSVVTIFRRWKCLKPTLLVEPHRVCRWKTHSPYNSRMWPEIIEQKKKSFVVRRVFYLATLPSMFNFSK